MAKGKKQSDEAIIAGAIDAGMKAGKKAQPKAKKAPPVLRALEGERDLARQAVESGITRDEYMRAREKAMTGVGASPAEMAAGMADVELAANEFYPVVGEIAVAKAWDAIAEAVTEPALGKGDLVERVVTDVTGLGDRIVLDRPIYGKEMGGVKSAGISEVYLPQPQQKKIRAELGVIGKLIGQRVELKMRDGYANVSTVRLLGPVATTPEAEVQGEATVAAVEERIEQDAPNGAPEREADNHGFESPTDATFEVGEGVRETLAKLVTTEPTTALEKLLATGDVVVLDVDGKRTHFYTYSGICKLLDAFKENAIAKVTATVVQYDANGVRSPKVKVAAGTADYRAEAMKRLTAKLVLQDGHLLFTGTKHPSAGFGMMYYGGQMRPAHRVAWELVNGPIPEGMNVTHVKGVCSEKTCCEISHLTLTPKSGGGGGEPKPVVVASEPKKAKPLTEVRNAKDLDKAINGEAGPNGPAVPESAKEQGARYLREARQAKREKAPLVSVPETAVVVQVLGYAKDGNTTRTKALDWMLGDPHNSVARFAVPRAAVPALHWLCKCLGYDDKSELSGDQRAFIVAYLGITTGEASRWAGALDGVARKLDTPKKHDGPFNLYDLTHTQAERLYLALGQWNVRRRNGQQLAGPSPDQLQALEDSLRFLNGQLQGTSYLKLADQLGESVAIMPTVLPAFTKEMGEIGTLARPITGIDWSEGK